MKWLVTFIGALCIVGIIIFFVKNQNPIQKPKVLPANTSINTPIPTPANLKQSIVVDVDKIPIRISWAIVNPEQVELYSNLKDQKLSEEIKVNKSCSILVNGGFYSKENTHLGLFITDFKTVSDPILSSLLNGFIWINADNKTLISTDRPSVTPRIALQTGPLLMLDNKPLLLAIKNDEPSRRIVAGITNNSKLIFMVFYRDSAEYQGPMLESLPEIINLFKKQTGIDIVDAINLDGGSASVFISKYDLLRELKIVGSYFCAK